MSESSTASNQNKSITLSRNAPIALVVGCAGFLGSKLTFQLIKRGIQVIGIDNLSTGTQKNLEQFIESKRFEFLEQSIVKTPDLKLPRLDYAFFLADEDGINRTNLFRYGIPSFLRFVKDYSAKITFVSDIAVYNLEVDAPTQGLRQAEIYFARYVKEHKLNGRIVRLSSVFGPGMKFLDNDKLHKLIKESIADNLSRQNGMLDLATRAIFIDDAVDLIVKSAFGGSTAHKIYDGSLMHPIKLAEVKEVLLKPELLEQETYKLTVLPEWPTPNLEKTVKELSWYPKTDYKTAVKQTLNYFHQIRVVSGGNSKFPAHNPPLVLQASEETSSVKNPSKNKVTQIATVICLIALIGYGLVYPLLKLGLGALVTPILITQADSELKNGDLSKAQTLLGYAGNFAGSLEETLPFISLFDNLPYLKSISNQIEQRSQYLTLQVRGMTYVIEGFQNLGRIFSGAMNRGAGESQLFLSTQNEFSAGQQDLTYATKVDPQLMSDADNVQALAEEGRTAGDLLSMLAGSGNKTYLVVMEDNSRPTLGGGEVESIGTLELTNGQLGRLEFTSSSSLDQKLQSPLGVDNLRFEDLSAEPDFPTNAKELEYSYQTIDNQPLDGVLSIDTAATDQLIKSLGGVIVPGYSLRLSGGDLTGKLATYQDQTEQFLAQVENALFNSLSHMSYKQTLDLLPVLQNLLTRKHILLYADEPSSYAYLISNDLSGALKRPETSDGLDDFLEVASAEASGSGILKKSLELTTQIDQSGGVSENLKVTLENLSTASSSAKLAFYLPQGAEVKSASMGGSDVLSSLNSNLIYGRAGFFINLPMQSGETKDLDINYMLSDHVYFISDTNEAKYQLAVFKQNSDQVIPLIWTLKLPNSVKIKATSDPDMRVSPSGASLILELSSDIQTNLIFTQAK